jgi:PAS domain S-box-containing protein
MGAMNDDGARLIRNQAALFDTPDQAVIATTLEGRIVYWSQSASRVYGWAADDVLGRNVMEITVSPTAQEEALEIMELLRAGKSWTGDFTVCCKNGEAVEARVCDLPVLDQAGRLSGIVGISWPRGAAEDDGLPDLVPRSPMP